MIHIPEYYYVGRILAGLQGHSKRKAQAAERRAARTPDAAATTPL